MTDCIFCRIVLRELPAEILAETDQCLVFADIAPQAPVHVLAIPKVHVSSLAETRDSELVGHLVTQLAMVAERDGYAGRGYRVVINNGADGGQAVDHLHAHLLAGRTLAWPPG